MRNSKKILLTGGAGFIGSHLADRLIAEGHKVIVVDNLISGRKKNINEKAIFYNYDIGDSRIAGVFEKEKPEIVFHYAAQVDIRKSIKEPVGDINVNILASLNILENCRKCKTNKIIFASSGGAIYGEAKIIPTPEGHPENPLSPYGINKLTAEKYLDYYYRIFGLPFVSLRLSNVYGPRQNSEGEGGVAAVFFNKMLSGEQPTIYGNGKQTRDFVFVDDVVEASILAMEKEETGIFNIGTGQETNINTIFRKIKELTKSEAEENYSPSRQGNIRRSCLDYSKAKEKLNWLPKCSLEQGLDRTLRYE